MAKLDIKNPTAPVRPSDHVIAAFHQLKDGTANEGQQKDALDWIIKVLCRTYDLSYRPDSQRDTDFAEGKRFVGLQIVNIINVLKPGGNP